MKGSLNDVSFSLPPLQEVLAVLSLSSSYNATIVVVGTTLLGIAAGVVGTFTILRKRALVGDALAHAALPGLAIAFMLAEGFGFESKSLPTLLLGATLSGIAGILCIQALTRFTRLNEDAAIGIVLSVFFGVGVVLLSVIQTMNTGSEGGLEHFIYGQTAAMNKNDALITFFLAGFSIISAVLLFKEFKLLCFDQEFAGVQGWPVTRIDLLMMALVVLVTIIGLQSVGLILVIALLIIPPSAARFWSDSLKTITILSGLFGGASGYFGSSISAILPRMPTGSIIVITAGTIFLVSFLFAPKRGICSNAIRRLKLKLRVSKDHILRTVYEHLETNNMNLDEPLKLNKLLSRKGWTDTQISFGTFLLEKSGLIEQHSSISLLTPEGANQAQRLTRNHRLWEEYLISYGSLPACHVDLAADMVEHVLSDDLVESLEEELRRKGTLPPSVHPIQSIEGT